MGQAIVLTVPFRYSSEGVTVSVKAYVCVYYIPTYMYIILHFRDVLLEMFFKVTRIFPI